VEYVLPGKALATGGGTVPGNNVQKFRESLMMSKAELARKAGLSTLTIDRIEAGRPCRLDTKRKILLALGMKVSDKDRVFGPGSDEAAPSASRAAGGVPAVSGDPVRRS
jgi:DNA-binding XRE family transcriptional regulator